MIWIKIRYRLKLFFRSILFKIGFKNLLLRNRYGERIIVFHGIDQKGETAFNSRFFSEAYFESFIKYLKVNFNLISLQDYYDKKFEKGTLNIAITFDDGYLNNYKYAFPILKKYEVPASFYITTVHDHKAYLWPDFVDLISFHTSTTKINFLGMEFNKNSKKEFIHKNLSLKQYAKTLDYKSIEKLYEVLKQEWINLPPSKLEDYWKLMEEKHIREISSHPLFEIGSHAETHVNLREIPLETAKKEIINSKSTLESITKTNCDIFAFPFGTYSNELAEFCLSIGFKKILLLDYNTPLDKKNPAYKNRFMLNPYISQDMQILCLLKGNYY